MFDFTQCSCLLRISYTHEEIAVPGNKYLLTMLTFFRGGSSFPVFPYD